MSNPSWAQIAHTLASRLVYADFCPNGHTSLLLPEVCPNCADRAALAAYRKKCHSMNVQPIDPFSKFKASHTEEINIWDAPKSKKDE